MKTAIVTGASSGIGAVFARRLEESGYRVLTVSRSAGTLQADLSTGEGIEAAERLITECSELAMLVNNAGFGTLGRFWEASLAGQEKMHRLHVLATVRLTHAALRVMTLRNGAGPAGKIINVSSVAGFGQSPGKVSYCATKAWMNSFTEGLALELRAAGSPVRVQALCPGYTRTGFHRTMGMKRETIPGWLWLDAEEVVEQSLRSNRVIVIPGWKYRVAASFLRHLPWSVKSRLRSPGRP